MVIKVKSRVDVSGWRLIRDCILAVLFGGVLTVGITYLLASWSVNDWHPFAHGDQVPWGTLARLAVPLTALFGAIVGAVIAGHGQSAKLRELRNTEDANVTERLTRAIEQLAHGHVDVRQGGIYALERIAEDSERDRKTIVRLLRSALYGGSMRSVATAQGLEDRPRRLQPQEEGALILSLLRLRRPNEPDVLASYLGFRADLDGADLRGTYLRNGNFSGMFLIEADFRGADAGDASFARAILASADFKGSNLRGADFSNAEVAEVSFRDADLRNADLTGAWLDGADFTRAKVGGVKVTEDQAKVLTSYLSHRQMASLEVKFRGVDNKIGAVGG